MSVYVFEKWHGCLNDFLVIFSSEDSKARDLQLLTQKASKLCDRSGGGVGADGILLLTPLCRNCGKRGKRGKCQKGRKCKGREGEFFLDIINKDGSLAANCGNGLRVACLYVCKRFPALEELAKSRNTSLEIRFHVCTSSASLGSTTSSKSVSENPFVTRLVQPLSKLLETRSGRSSGVKTEAGGWVEVTMPCSKACVIKSDIESEISTNTATNTMKQELLQAVLVHSHEQQTYSLQSIDVVRLANEHVTLHYPNLRSHHSQILEKMSKRIKQSFGDRFNMHLYDFLASDEEELAFWRGVFSSDIKGMDVATLKPPSMTFTIIPWERGVGLTQACGSGAVSVAMAYHRKNHGDSRSCTYGIKMPGGRLLVSVGGVSVGDEAVKLVGPAEYVFSGEISL